jgi:hypothetical protein
MPEFTVTSGYTRKPQEDGLRDLMQTTQTSGYTRAPAPESSSTAPSYVAQTREVQDNDLAQHQLNRILSKDSPLIQLSKTQGMQYGNSRGLLNSSIAAGASQNAMIQNAAPIATNDANTYFNQGRANQDSTNQFRLTQATHQHEAAEAAKQRAFQAEQNERQRAFQAQQDAIIREFQARENALEREFQGSQNSAERQARMDELARQSATELFRQVAGMNATLTDSIAKIQAADLKSANKQSMINNMIEQHYNNLSITTAMADFEIVNGKVVYNASGPANTQAQPPERPAPEYPYSGAYYGQYY